MEMSFHVPNSNTQFVGDENRPPAQVSLFATLVNTLLLL
jgi:structure-specific recognition protein 1